MTLNFLEVITDKLSQIACDGESILKNDFDMVVFNLISSNIVPIMAQYLFSPSFSRFQAFVVANEYPHTCDLLRTMYSSKRFTQWVMSPKRNSYSLDIILESIFPARVSELPPELSTEIARCLISASLLIKPLSSSDLKLTVSLLISTIARFLKYSPESFCNASTVYCLQQVKTSKIIAPPLADIRNHPELAKLDAVLQLVRFSNYHIHINNKYHLLKLASISPSMKAEILNHHFHKFQKDPKELKFLYNNIAIDTTAQNAIFNEFPDNLTELSILLRSQSKDKLKKLAYTEYLQKILNLIFVTIKNLPTASCNLSILVSSSKVMSSLIGYENYVFQKEIRNTHRFNGFEALSPHFIAVACAVAESMISSPLFPHFDCNNPSSFVLKAAFDDMSLTLISRPKELLTYLFNTDPTPCKCSILVSGLTSSSAKPYLKNWKFYFIANITKLVQYGISLLKIPSEITVDITAQYYLSLVKFSVEQNLDKGLIQSLLSVPIELTCVIGKKTLEMEVINSQKTLSHFFSFIEKVLQSPIVKSFILLVARRDFWDSLFFWLNPNVMTLTTKLPSKIIRIFSKLSDFDNTMNNTLVGTQRVIVDCLHFHLVDIIIDHINNLRFEDLNVNISERSLFVVSILQLLLSWCSPPPLASYVVMKIRPELVEAIHQFGVGTPFENMIVEMVNILNNEFEKAAKGDPKEIVAIQTVFEGEKVDALLNKIFFTVLKQYQQKKNII
ncbi:hypothetical protein GPJ56_002874 [Histomonas meleagridis]|uniref:uncharacterized protein n=1 Tax=Histomonas meleagridis TaxID=135588 RepID=UPI0035599D78|nr:hypothetical protein GPJ56_002874 [Histomonas meleagridis]KAH0800425.1 hypothetical protein GO595_006836 [Histomonas meleagridis]